MNEMKPKTFSQNKKIIYDWIDKKKLLIPYKMLKFSVRHGVILVKVLEIISFKQSNWLEKKQFLLLKK